MMTPVRGALAGYAAALAIPIATMLIGSRFGMPPFVFEHLIILFVVGIAVVWGMAPAVVAALAAALGDNVILRDPTGRPTITGIRDVFDLVMFVAVAVIVGWLVASARRDRALAEMAAAREREAREDRDRLVAMVSHDLATPLAVIRGTIQFARHAGPRMTVDLERLWVRLDTAAARAASLVRTLADARSLHTGEFTLQFRPVDVRELVTPVVQMMDRMSERHPLVLALPADPATIACDPERLQSVFENLLSNSIKYSPDGGSIEVSVDIEDTMAVVTVRDHGMGISSDALPRLFERGYRAREAVSTAPGLGLGLNISAEIVKRHGGTIEARRGQPLGSVVIVRLPLVKERRDRQAVHRAPDQNTADHLPEPVLPDPGRSRGERS
jgi:signal transduction histidine kinase